MQNFIRGSDITLTGDLPGVNKHTIDSLPSLADQLTRLELSGLDKISDDVFGDVIGKLPNLEVVILRWVVWASSDSSAETPVSMKREHEGCCKDGQCPKDLHSPQSRESELHERPGFGHGWIDNSLSELGGREAGVLTENGVAGMIDESLWR